MKAIVRRRPMPIMAAAVELIVSRTKFAGAPWEAVQVYRMAATVAKGEGAGAIEVEHVEEVFRMQRVDELGLRWLDRRVIEALLGQPRYKADRTFVCYAASESNTCQLAQVDKAEYRESIRPRLMGRGLLEVRPTYGQALTATAVEVYGGGGRRRGPPAPPKQLACL